MDQGEQPDICIAIDFGTTCTGVAWLLPKLGSNIQIFKDWPGSDSSEPKVPSVLAKERTGKTTDWGFPSRESGKHSKNWVFLKMVLDPTELRKSQKTGASFAPMDEDEVDRLVTEYLSRIYRHISANIPDDAGRRRLPGKGWKDWTVQFIFSTPTTWDQSVIEHFREIIHKAGFGEVDRHKVEVGLTESEAAAVYAAKWVLTLEKGDILMTIDAGGGTTDMAFLKSTVAEPPTLEPVSAIMGIGIGSMQIDSDFQRLLNRRLVRYPESKEHLHADFAQKVARGKDFMYMKHRFGEAAYRQDNYSLEVSGVPADYAHPDVRIKHGCLSVTHEEVEALFDRQVQAMKERILRALDEFESDRPKSIKYVVLSGGLGGSAYVLDEVKKIFQNEGRYRNFVCETEVQSCPEPQLAVVKGLLEDWKYGTLRTRISRVNYGVVIEQLYCKKSHFDQAVRLDPFDKKKYVTDEIHWLVRKGDRMTAGQVHSYTIERRLGLNDVEKEWTEKFVFSENDGGYLPKNTTQPGVSPLRDVPVCLKDERSLKKVTKLFRKSYRVSRYNLNLTVLKSGDLSFTASPEHGVIIAGDIEPVPAQLEIEEMRTSG